MKRYYIAAKRGIRNEREIEWVKETIVVNEIKVWREKYWWKKQKKNEECWSEEFYAIFF